MHNHGRSVQLFNLNLVFLRWEFIEMIQNDLLNGLLDVSWTHFPRAQNALPESSAGGARKPESRPESNLECARRLESSIGGARRPKSSPGSSIGLLKVTCQGFPKWSLHNESEQLWLKFFPRAAVRSPSAALLWQAQRIRWLGFGDHEALTSDMPRSPKWSLHEETNSCGSIFSHGQP